jgi:hypothetical protein
MAAEHASLVGGMADDGSTVLSAPAITDRGAAVKSEPTWSVVGVGDFSGNGTDDLL